MINRGESIDDCNDLISPQLREVPRLGDRVPCMIQNFPVLRLRSHTAVRQAWLLEMGNHAKLHAEIEVRNKVFYAKCE